LQLLELFDIGAPVGQTAGDAAPEKNDVGQLALADRFGVLLLAGGRFRLFLFLERRPLLGVKLYRRIGPP
jgi:hypothetical protein